MQKINLFLRIGLFTLILGLGTAAALIVDETRSLALADMSDAPVGAIAEASGDTLYAAVQGEQRGLYRSDDNGYAWQRVTAGSAENITALAVHPLRSNLLYAGITGQTEAETPILLTSVNGGRTWSQVDFTLPVDDAGPTPEISVITVSPDQPGVVYVGTSGHGVYRFHSPTYQTEIIGGSSFANLYVKDVVTASDGQVYAVATDGLFKINGSRLEEIETLPAAPISLVTDPTNPKTLYAGTVGYGAYRSDDGGQSWTPINEGLNWQPGILLWVPAIAIDPENPEHLALATGIGVGSQTVSDGIFESFDGGQSWTRIAQPATLVEELSIEAGGVYALTENGLTRYGDPLSAPTTTIWTRLASLAQPTGVQVLIMLLTVLFAGWVFVARLTWMPGWTRKNV